MEYHKDTGVLNVTFRNMVRSGLVVCTNENRRCNRTWPLFCYFSPSVHFCATIPFLSLTEFPLYLTVLIDEYYYLVCLTSQEKSFKKNLRRFSWSNHNVLDFRFLICYGLATLYGWIPTFNFSERWKRKCPAVFSLDRRLIQIDVF